MNYTELLIEADNLSLITKDKPLRAYDGRIRGNRIAIRKDMPELQKKCVLAEELGHYYTTLGDILNQNEVQNRKQEHRARMWAYNRLIGLYGIIDCYKAGCRTIYDMAEHLEVTEEFLAEALESYRRKYGLYKKLDNYVIYFKPNLSVFELI